MTTLIDHPSQEDILPIQRFVVRSPLVAMKSLGRRKLVTLEKRTAGHILETYGERGTPGLVMVAVEEERFLVWKRDLEERAELLPAHFGIRTAGSHSQISEL